MMMLVMSSVLFSACSLGVAVDRSGNATCKSNGLVVFSGRITMVGESLVDPSELPTKWEVIGPDMTCEIDFAN